MKKIKLSLYILLSAALFTGCSIEEAPGSDISEVSGNDGDTSSSYISEPSESTVPDSSSAESSDTSSLPAESSEPDSPEFNAKVRKVTVSEKNPLLKAPLEYTVNEESKTISLDVTYENYADLYTLKNCFLDIEVESGEYSLSGTFNADGSLDLTGDTSMLVTDSGGNRRTYSVVTDRTVYDLPIVNIYLDNMADVSTIQKTVYSNMSFYLDCTGAEGFESTEMIGGRIRGRGHSTWKWEKKPYRIKLDESVPVLGMQKNKDWILLANYADKSLIRNIVAYDMGRALGNFVWDPKQYAVDLFVNGEYRGVYALGEQREIAKSRIDIDKNSSAPDTGYLMEVGGADGDGLTLGVDYFHTDKNLARFVTFIEPSSDKLTEEQRKFIMDYVNKAEAAIVAGDGYDEYIDVDSFIDWMIIQELTCNLDSCFRRSCYITKDKGGKLQMGPIWDFDLAFGNFSMDDPSYSTWYTIGSDSSDAYIRTNWCNYLMNDEEFRSRFKARWFEVKDKLLDTARKSIDRNSALIQRSQTENFRVWDILGIKVGYESWTTAQYTTYESQLQFLRDFLTKRAKWIDEHI